MCKMFILNRDGIYVNAFLFAEMIRLSVQFYGATAVVRPANVTI